MVLLELFREAGEGKAISLLPELSGLSLFRSEPFTWVPRGVYIGLPPGGTIVIRLGAGPSRLSLRPPSFPPASRARRLAGPVDRLDTVAALLMTQARSSGRGNSAAVYRAITVTIPHLIWLRARGARGGVGRLQGGRLPQVRLRAPRPPSALPLIGGPAAFGSYRPASWAQCSAHCG